MIPVIAKIILVAACAMVVIANLALILGAVAVGVGLWWGWRYWQRTRAQRAATVTTAGAQRTHQSSPAAPSPMASLNVPVSPSRDERWRAAAIRHMRAAAR